MNIIGFLRKVGILRIGGGTYKGNVGGEYATIDMDRGSRPEGTEESKERPARDPAPGAR